MLVKTLVVISLIAGSLGIEPVFAGDTVTLTGQIVDKKKILLQGIMDEGARWSGKLDAMSVRSVNIRAHASDGSVSNTNPNPNGTYQLQTEAPVEKIVLEVDGGGLYYEKKGPWTLDAAVSLDLEGLFVVEGQVKTANGAPGAFKTIRALDADGETMSRGLTRAKGNFKFLSNRPIASLSVDISYSSPTVLEGPWSSGAKVSIASSA